MPGLSAACVPGRFAFPIIFRIFGFANQKPQDDGDGVGFYHTLVCGGLCGTVIGLDREYRVKDAGFRTHFLVALGSALMMIVSQYGFADILTHTGVGLDPSASLRRW